MLCQLVCIDRRYQRMNCFNIREVQTLLRSKYHPSFLDILEHHQLLENTVIGLRFKLFGLDSINPNMSLMFDHSISKTNTDRNTLYTFIVIEESNSTFFSNFFNKVALKLLNIFSNCNFSYYNVILDSTSTLSGLN